MCVCVLMSVCFRDDVCMEMLCSGGVLCVSGCLRKWTDMEVHVCVCVCVCLCLYVFVFVDVYVDE